MKKFLTLALLCATALASLGCSPKFDWREARGTDAPFVVLLPGKPDTHTRTIDLDGVKVPMTMTAVQIDGAVFAVGNSQLADAAQARKALAAIKTALPKNINGTIVREKSITISKFDATEIEVRGTQNRNGQAIPVRMVARLLASDRRVFQILAFGEDKALPADAIDMFMTSFKLN